MKVAGEIPLGPFPGSEPVGVVGLGRLGCSIARHLLGAGARRGRVRRERGADVLDAPLSTVVSDVIGSIRRQKLAWQGPRSTSMHEYLAGLHGAGMHGDDDASGGGVR